MMSSRRRWRVRPSRVCIWPWPCRPGAKATPPASVAPNAAAERRRRVYALLDAADLARGRAVRWCESALGMLRSDGDMREARLLLRAALAAGVHRPTVYRAWTAMEADHAGDGDAARALFEEWRVRLHQEDNDKEEEDVGGFWCRYIAFELGHGGAARTRAVAERAVAACPRDPAVHAGYARAELRLRRADRARAVVAHALKCLDDDRDREWLVDEVKRYGNAMRGRRRQLIRRLCGFFPRLFRGGWWSRPSRGYNRLD
ncbi:hypothetical protein PR202_ga31064 [Eleusine coracana subsp. coracana]|uniref:Uncharacterized protein n=1 Tax=Eleusine coracana subsp. coracana TaxID=191504 RepID=A0AAV5DQZ2_ELECO|nr:hypothetical protein QOZ80_3AG0228740 [Eleusine coracana subsp. coracana]GJN12757.1 hypothetical protein PR202_ga31064 [Eleusine coracana subsp. coracana]